MTTTTSTRPCGPCGGTGTYVRGHGDSWKCHLCGGSGKVPADAPEPVMDSLGTMLVWPEGYKETQ